MHVDRPLVQGANQPRPQKLHARVTLTSIATPHTSSTDRDEIIKKRGGGREGEGWREACILNSSVITKQRGERGPGHANTRQWRRPGLSPLHKKPLNNELKAGRCQGLEENSGRASQGNRGAEGTAMVKPPRGWKGLGCRSIWCGEQE